jgi:hypothetical protein
MNPRHTGKTPCSSPRIRDFLMHPRSIFYRRHQNAEKLPLSPRQKLRFASQLNLLQRPLPKRYNFGNANHRKGHS